MRPTFDRPDLGILPFREHMRQRMPLPKDGWVSEDVDCVVRAYGGNFDTDTNGKFMLLEYKEGRAWPRLAQQMTFGLIDSLLKMADPERERYLGYYIIGYDKDSANLLNNIRINGVPCDFDVYEQFLAFKRKDIAPYVFPEVAQLKNDPKTLTPEGVANVLVALGILP